MVESHYAEPGICKADTGIHSSVQRQGPGRPVICTQLQQSESLDKVVDVPVQKQVHVPRVSVQERTVEVPQLEYADHNVCIPMHKHRHVPVMEPVQKPVAVTENDTDNIIVEVPVVIQVDVPQIQTVEQSVEVPFVQEHRQLPVVVVVDGPVARQEEAPPRTIWRWRSLVFQQLIKKARTAALLLPKGSCAKLWPPVPHEWFGSREASLLDMLVFN